nr:unnamed protein product [Callosobruchus analis]
MNSEPKTDEDVRKLHPLIVFRKVLWSDGLMRHEDRRSSSSKAGDPSGSGSHVFISYCQSLVMKRYEGYCVYEYTYRHQEKTKVILTSHLLWYALIAFNT